MEPVAVIHAEDGEIDSNSDEDDDNGIIAINDAPLLVVTLLLFASSGLSTAGLHKRALTEE